MKLHDLVFLYVQLLLDACIWKFKPWICFLLLREVEGGVCVWMSVYVSMCVFVCVHVCVCVCDTALQTISNA